MKTKIYSLLLVVFIYSNYQAKAQGDAVQFIKAGKDDGNRLISAYLGPLFDGFGASMNNGWYNTAKSHGLGGFDISATYSIIQIGPDQQNFDASKINLNTDTKYPRLIILSSNPNGSIIPTIYGNDQDSTKVKVVQRFNQADPNSDSVITSFKFPPGLGLQFGPGLPTAQAAIGIGFGTEVMLRITPKLNTGDIKAGMFGFGLKHNFSHWIWKGNTKPPLDIAGIFGYNALSAEINLGDNYVKPDSGVTIGALPDADYKNSQKMTFAGSGLMFGAVVSKKISFITFYVGANYNHAKITLKTEGQYPVTFIETDISNPNFGKHIILNFKDPIVIDRSLDYFRFTGGVRIKLGIITINGEYNLAPVKTISFGLGINLQSIKPFAL